MRLIYILFCLIFFTSFIARSEESIILKSKDFSLHVHLPRIEIIEEEDDFFNDDIYMWFIITRDGLTYAKMTQIYRNYDEGSILVLNQDDRIISNQPFYQHLIIDYGLVESDGDDTRELLKISENASRILTQLNQSKSFARKDELRELLLRESRLFMQTLLSFNHDDRLISSSLNITYQHTHRTWQNSLFYEDMQEFRGQNNASDWHYKLIWRYLLVDNTPSALFL